MKLVYFLFALCFAIQVDAQQNNKSKATAFYIKGEDALLRLEYEKAMRYFDKALHINSELVACHRAIGVCLYGLDKYKEAAEQYDVLLQRSPNFSRVLYYEMAQSYYKSGQYQKALDYFRQFESLQEKDISRFGLNGAKEIKIEQGYISKLPKNILACQNALDIIKYNKHIEIKNLGANINTKGDEYFPYLSANQTTLLYTSKIHKQAGENLLYSNNNNDVWERGQLMADSFNTSYNEGMSTLTHDGSQMFFTSCGLVKRKIDCNIKSAALEEGQIVSISDAEGYLNTTEWESQASISCDGRLIFFASNREGSIGGTDIWFSRMQADGTWSIPKNAGLGVNTNLDEEAPFISRDGSTLYFSSNGHLGLGEQDLFFSKKNPIGKWGQAINLGSPINTAQRELGFFISANGQSGLFSSNRENGYGGMDIYTFELSENLHTKSITYVEGFVKDAQSNEPVQTVLNANSAAPIITDADGRFFICLEAKRDFDILIEENNYLVFEAVEEIPFWDNKVFYPLNIFLEPINIESTATVASKESIVLDKDSTFIKAPEILRQSIYFDYNSFDLNPDELGILDKLAQVLEDQDVLSIEISAYCDNRGSSAYNETLSDQRAQSLQNYFIEHQIVVRNFISVGYGELPFSDTPHMNRRADVVVKYFME